MLQTLSLPRLSRKAVIAAATMLALLAAAAALWAQVEGDRGIAPVASSGDIEVGGVEVDVRGENAEDAREKGWREAQRKAWEKLGGPDIPDSQLQGLVAAVVIEQENIGPRRYVARLGVTFDRGRAGALLGASGRGPGSAPMLLVPVTRSAGTYMVYEARNPWQRAWAEYQAGSSRINYVRPSGAGGDSLLITYGQTDRRSRTWWRNVLDQFSAADVLVPVAHLDYKWPGGPIEGRFTARYGPDNAYLDSFTLTAESPEQLQPMLDQAVLRFNAIFERALAEGKLRPDPTLDLGTVEADRAIQRLIELGRAALARDRSDAAAREAELIGETAPGEAATPPAAAQVATYLVQFATPDAGAFDASIAAVRAAPGVRSAAVTSTAIGGHSVMSVGYAGSMDQLAEALRARGFTVRQSGNVISISR
ncbi:heavy-metal-associated domain-containing protein [Pelagerythrobacter rhizovicinus]|uniref:Heavy-metal-associated domain-containing protein n=1 Tax=Pelagerythrobacter rhizovicinus TaxID=2268576 RepID=A0A4Q2KK68_9SPHN|nr:heavy-metal-associated domain-containing protein [Pelagerythrobacter rhizovicinus]RXZ65654.1 heavy-metal-associated domain-containing protein [Pelagerythrobacter rhizovicinus]